MPVKMLSLQTQGKGLYEFTDRVEQELRGSGIESGLCCVFVQHTSASLIIQENADPSARRDLERWFERHVPEGDALYTHTQEGPDDMPSHIRAVLTQTSIVIPVIEGQLALGTWQGIYLFEHRTHPMKRQVVVSFLRDA